MKRHCRLLERAKTKSKNTPRFDQASNNLKRAYKTYHNALNQTRISSTLKIMTDNKNDPKTIFKIAERLCKNVTPSVKSSITPSQFSSYFLSKIESIRSSISCHQPDLDNIHPIVPPSSLSNFSPTNAEEVSKLISSSKKTFSPLDTIPSKFYHSYSSIITPYLVEIFNLSMASGLVPANYKRAAVKPILKKSGTDCKQTADFSTP